MASELELLTIQMIGDIFGLFERTESDERKTIKQLEYDKDTFGEVDYVYQTFEHGLGTADVLVYLVRNDTHHGINQIWSLSGDEEMTWFNLTENEITIEIRVAGMADDDIRIMIWKFRTT